ncbi:hypothetical protein E4U26_004680 [Claviceps purpurea]|nr:hypothetical protein E4U26_004680 [Claviceps purpurea]
MAVVTLPWADCFGASTAPDSAPWPTRSGRRPGRPTPTDRGNSPIRKQTTTLSSEGDEALETTSPAADSYSADPPRRLTPNSPPNDTSPIAWSPLGKDEQSHGPGGGSYAVPSGTTSTTLSTPAEIDEYAAWITNELQDIADLAAPKRPRPGPRTHPWWNASSGSGQDRPESQEALMDTKNGGNLAWKGPVGSGTLGSTPQRNASRDEANQHYTEQKDRR